MVVSGQWSMLVVLAMGRWVRGVMVTVTMVMVVLVAEWYTAYGIQYHHAATMQAHTWPPGS